MMAVCVVVFALSGCKAKHQNRRAEPEPQRVAIPQGQAKPSPPQDASVAEDAPLNASETQLRALHRYKENVWFIQEASRVAQRYDTLNAAISTLLKAGRPDWDHSNPSHQQIRGTKIAAELRPWLEELQTLEPAKRAATLLIADRIVVMEEEDGNLEPPDSEKPPAESNPSESRPKSEAQLQLEGIGAKFLSDSTSERNLYALNWLRQSYELDPNGRAGDLAFLLLMQRGFNTSPGCENGNELFRQVLRRGTEYLRQRRSADIEARVHFMMGDAYRDIVALAADQHGDTYANSAAYKSEEANARTRAAAEYRAGLALDDKSEVSIIAKERLRGLQAGEAPPDTTFYCQIMD